MSTDGRPGLGPDANGGAPAPAGGMLLPDPDARRAALEQVLRSVTFERADQLRHFLRYVCEMELAGRGAELNEHLIGVEALGKPPRYSTTDDSSVRRCAHALRQKLEEAYAGELAGSRIRIELPRGGYQPRFQVVPTESRHGRAPGWTSWGIPWMVGSFVLGLLIGAAALDLARPAPTASAAPRDPVLAEAWGPLARPGANTLICLSAPAHYGILPYPDGPLPPKVSFLPDSNELASWWQRHYPLPPGHRLASHLTSGPIRLGEVMGLVAALRTLGRLGVEPEVVAEKYAMLPALRGRNVLLFGNPEYSHAAVNLLAKTPLTVAYDASLRDRVVRSNASQPPRLYKPERDERGALTDALGLITVLPSEGATPQAHQRTIVISCTNAAGCQAALEFLSSPGSLAAFRQRLLAEGLSGFPPGYQVVIRSDVFLSAQSLSGAYEAHVVFQR
jgi:hypothetical protein